MVKINKHAEFIRFVNSRRLVASESAIKNEKKIKNLFTRYTRVITCMRVKNRLLSVRFYMRFFPHPDRPF